MKTNRRDGHQFRNKVRWGDTEDAANFAASFVKGYLEGVHKTSLMTICEPSFGPISENGEDNGIDNVSPGNKRETTNRIT